MRLNNLDIDIPEDLKEKISAIQLTPELALIIKVNEDIIESNIDFKTLGKKIILDWPKTVEKIMSRLRVKEVDHQLLAKIHIILNNNVDTFRQYIDAIKENKETAKVKLTNKPKIRIFKYYSEKDNRLYELAVINGKCRFVSYENEKLAITEEIDEDSRILIPFGIGDTPVKPYEFKDMDELLTYIENAKSMKIDLLYKNIKKVISKYIDQNNTILNIIAIDIVFSYFQDRFPTTHYLFLTGDNNVGKSVIGDAFEQLAYRGAKMTSPSVANIYRLIGKVEPSQCSLILDEADDIDNHNDILKVLKTGYTINGKVPKINTHDNSIQEFFNTYSLKIFIAEKPPNSYKARGLVDRTFQITCLLGRPELNIKEVLVPQGKFGNPRIKELQEELSHLRNSLFAYRLVNAFKRSNEIDTGLKNRDKELCEGVVLFYDTEVQKEVEQTFQELLDSKHIEKQESFEALLLFLILQLIGNSKTHGEIFIEDLWNGIKNTIANFEEGEKDNEIYLPDYNLRLYRNQLTNRCKKFGAESKRANKGNKVIFKDLNKLKQIFDSYSIEDRPRVNCTIKKTENEESGGSGRSTERDDVITNDK